MEQETTQQSSRKNLIFIIIALIGFGAIALMFTSGDRAEAPENGDPVQEEEGEELEDGNEEGEGDETQPTTPATETVSVYFVRVVDGQEELVRISRTIPRTPGIARATLTQLLQGPTEAEVSTGLATAIPEGVALQDIRIENGVAYADFNSALDEGVAGSALVTIIRGQIEQTLLQFPTVQSVVISIDGESEEILQP